MSTSIIEENTYQTRSFLITPWSILLNFHRQKYQSSKRFSTNLSRMQNFLNSIMGNGEFLTLREKNFSLQDSLSTIKKLGKTTNIDVNDTCFVIMPFANPLGNHYSLIF